MGQETSSWGTQALPGGARAWVASQDPARIWKQGSKRDFNQSVQAAWGSGVPTPEGRVGRAQGQVG